MPATNLTPEQRAKNIKLLRMYIYGMTVVLIAVGLSCFVKPDIIHNLLALDDQGIRIFGGTLLAVALFDIFFFGRLLKDADSK
ncbi:MAG: hypothetical protein ACK4NR_06955 [Micavibrio sp.]